MNSTSTVRQLTDLVGGTLVGDGSLAIQAARPLQDAGPGDLTFVEDDKHLRQLAKNHPSAIIIKPGHELNGLTRIEVADPLGAFLKVFRHLHGRPERASHGIDPKASVHPTARIGSETSVHPFAVIEEGVVIGDRCRLFPGAFVGRFCRIGDDVVLHPNAVLYEGCTLGDRVIVHANAVIGKDGFGFRQHQGRHVRVPQLGSVAIANDVEIGSGTTIDRGTFQATRVGEGTKVDNQVQIAHNCRVGRHNLLVGQSGIAGSSTTGDYVVLAGQAGVVDHVSVGDRVIIGGQSAVIRDVPAGQCVLGTPARPDREAKVVALNTEKLPEIRRDIRRIKKHLGLGDE